ncbi:MULTISPECIES: cytochrome c oxidase subunit II [unclassified Sphingomonas]|uniref:cytochrome c oxidase subunit II n=1 Tax=unclassified Sphingomonas TaxID=196159 RepID=UPI0006F58780|nr:MULTISPECIES: cytochrome c oxidase subunit II [unclassified Sphingomonas]KQX17661.1 hypothetical protein ASD17_18200 [Sphingomonas sp. Root1294]KQY70587.1 hypothetical protein ASD39_22100 [Sphingomonas sp. Root50]KRB91923.1 hypothetical protein ASE22_08210 [Sphingomonas sp. Root720]
MTWAPLNYMSGSGSRAHAVLPLTWFTLIVSILTCLIFAALIGWGVLRARETASEPASEVMRGGNGIRWITTSLWITAVPLLITLIWTMAAIAETGVPPPHPGLILDVTPHQWWWEVQYSGTSPEQSFTTANEIHIPVGVPVKLRLQSPDVIHSFWVPQLAGKTDAIPGQRNETWLQADRPGRFRGQCAEFCGAQHARMSFEVVAEPPRAFERWRQQQLQTAPPPATAAQKRGLALFEFRCGLCHTVRGSQAHSHSAPDLTHLMSRATIAAAMLPNNRGALAGWIEAPQSLKPGTLMPDQHLSGAELNDVLAYVETLR